jgi:membrane-bound metal-dependent hydrolase YbcI (DUF457 family)
MSSKEEHQIFGALVGASSYLGYKNARNEPLILGELIGFALGGGFVASLPDEIEPPTNPKHRKFFHSGSALALAAVAAKAISENPQLTPMQKHTYLTGIAAYCGHLVQDSTTPAGLPIM